MCPLCGLNNLPSLHSSDMAVEINSMTSPHTEHAGIFIPFNIPLQD